MSRSFKIASKSPAKSGQASMIPTAMMMQPFLQHHLFPQAQQQHLTLSGTSSRGYQPYSSGVRTICKIRNPAEPTPTYTLLSDHSLSSASNYPSSFGYAYNTNILQPITVQPVANQRPIPLLNTVSQFDGHSSSTRSLHSSVNRTPIAYHHGTTKAPPVQSNVLKFQPSPQAKHAQKPFASMPSASTYLANCGIPKYWLGTQSPLGFRSTFADEPHVATDPRPNQLKSMIAGRVLNPNASDFVPTTSSDSSGDMTPSSSPVPSELVPETPRRSKSATSRDLMSQFNYDAFEHFADSLGGTIKPKFTQKQQKASTPLKGAPPAIVEITEAGNEIESMIVDNVEGGEKVNDSLEDFVTRMKFDELLKWDSDGEDMSIEIAKEDRDRFSELFVDEEDAGNSDVSMASNSTALSWGNHSQLDTSSLSSIQQSPSRNTFRPSNYRKGSVDLSHFGKRPSGTAASPTAPIRTTRAASFSCDASEHGHWAGPLLIPLDQSCQSRFKAQLYKTEMCRNISEFGTCQFGSECRFAHSEEERRHYDKAVHCKYKTEPCNEFENGICYYGSRCWFIHQTDTGAKQRKAIDTNMAEIFFDERFYPMMDKELDAFIAKSFTSSRSRFLPFFGKPNFTRG